MSWALLLDADDAASLGPLRLERGIEACLVKGRVWLRGKLPGDDLARRLRQLPALERYTVLDDGALLPDGALVPRGYLPEVDFVSLSALFELKPLTPALSPEGRGRKEIGAKASLILVRDDTLREPNLLLAELRTWCQYAATAPQVRLVRWSFAASATGQALIRGLPLPPIPGRRLVEQEGVAVEAGWIWSPRVDPPILRRKLNVEPGDLVLLLANGSDPLPNQQSAISNPQSPQPPQIVPASSFVRATRSAARQTLAGAGP